MVMDMSPLVGLMASSPAGFGVPDTIFSARMVTQG